MGLTLDGRELKLLREAMARLVSPLESEDVDAWRSDVNRTLRRLFGADKALFLLPGSRGSPFHSDEYSRDDLEPYLGYYRGIDEGFQRMKRRRLEVFCRAQLFPEGLRPLLRSECYHDFLLPNGIGDSMGMVANPGEGVPAGFWLHNERSGHPNWGERGMQILGLLLPAFRAATTLRRRFAGEEGRLGALLDALVEPAALFDLQGRTLHRNTALTSLVKGLEGPPVDGVLLSTARSVAALVAHPPHDGSGRVRRSLRVAGEPYAVNGILVERPLGLGKPRVLVTLERSPRQLLPPRRVVERCGLTPRQAEVALLMARGRTDRNIAEELGISHHTARGHAEAVLRRLGLHSRREVRERLEGGA